jgi:hypothetical protein
MHKTSAVVALILVALAGTADAQDVTNPPARTARREVSVSLLPMGLGKFTSQPGGMTKTEDAAFNYGLALQAGYVVLPGLTLGLAPQVSFNVKPKVPGGNGGQEIDLMARAAYTRQIVESIALFVEVLPGYSLIRPSPGDMSTGLVLAFGAGTMMELSDRAFATFGLGYQAGFQNLPAKDGSGEARARYVRVAIGVGTRF